MFGTVFDGYLAAIRADKFLLVKLSLILLHILAGFTASEVWLLALVALIVGEYRQGVLRWLVVVRAGRIHQLVVLFASLELQPLRAFGFDLLVYAVVLTDFCNQWVVFRQLNPLLAQRTYAEIEKDTRTDPSNLKPFVETLLMKYMPTNTPYARG